ncbi:heme exporter protein C [Granulicella pectinivorans]|jgi:heme exporter protein C|uniref:Heme exporter protein C n=1 Tax=Granulicella pectinivorans TaxID=474950 RepID=A0A1I6L2Y5_9BACT|nr:cytochrome c biogenesis protein CcsA [Granulicella pectinivorans]SFR97829.1 heme exporter protein C [Granulicella pectinivorans]
MAGKFVWAWGGLTAALLLYGLYVALAGSPPDAQQGNMIRAFYYHFPNWIGASVFLPLNLLASAAYLFLRNRNIGLAMKSDAMALASAEMGVVFCILGMVTGSLWGREEWGIWWTWDARLTTTLMLTLIYVAYLIVRHVVDGPSRATICAVLAIFGFVDMPIVYMSTTWWRTQHPAPVFGGGEGSGVARSILMPTLWNVGAWLAWGILVVSIRYAAEFRRQKREYEESMEQLGMEVHHV